MSEHTAAEHGHAVRGAALHSIGTRWLGVGLASVLCVVTVVLAATGRLSLYVNPDGAWFTVGMAVLGLVGAIASFALPLGGEADHGHDHATAAAPASAPARAAAQAVRPGPASTQPPRTRAEARLRQAAEAEAEAAAHAAAAHEHVDADPHVPHSSMRDAHAHHAPRRPLTLAAAFTGGVLASGVVVATLVLPPASLSAELAMARDLGAAPLFGGEDVVTLATTADLSTFGIGEWASLFQNTPDPRALEGTPVTLTGFVAPSDDDDTARLSRLVVTHCVIDAQPAAVPVALADWQSEYASGAWVEVTGTVIEASDGTLRVEPTEVREIDEPAEPYEY